MIFNRTQSDVNNAVRLIEEKVKHFQPLTVAEVETLERGTITASTINRIESKQEELKNLFEIIGYYCAEMVNKHWDSTQIFRFDDFQRILTNTELLRSAFFVYKNTPKTPAMSYHYDNINALEKILYDLDVMINDVKSHYRESGTFECGEE